MTSGQKAAIARPIRPLSRWHGANPTKMVHACFDNGLFSSFKTGVNSPIRGRQFMKSSRLPTKELRLHFLGAMGSGQ